MPGPIFLVSWSPPFVERRPLAISAADPGEDLQQHRYGNDSAADTQKGYPDAVIVSANLTASEEFPLLTIPRPHGLTVKPRFIRHGRLNQAWRIREMRPRSDGGSSIDCASQRMMGYATSNVCHEERSSQHSPREMELRGLRGYLRKGGREHFVPDRLQRVIKSKYLEDFDGIGKKVRALWSSTKQWDREPTAGR